jgi:uncharacterized protein (DUF427 family)
MDTMKIPGPDHPITLTAAPGRMRARFSGHVIADSADAILLAEASYRPICYFPREDIAMEFLARTERETHCPYKGHASYFTATMDGVIAENVAWSYERPYPAMAAISERLAFYPDHVEVYQVADDSAADDHADVSTAEVILHTDDGAGVSQARHWPATTRDPS